jgi:hypothetical protein
MRYQNQAGTATQRVLNSRQRLANTSFVGDATILERDVEVDTHEDAMMAKGEIANRKL